MLADDRTVCKLMRIPVVQDRSRCTVMSSIQPTPVSTSLEHEKLGLGTVKEIDPETALSTANTFKTSNKKTRFFGLILCSLVLSGVVLHHLLPGSVWHNVDGSMQTVNAACPQISAIAPSAHAKLLKALDSEYSTQTFKLKAYESLGQAVRVPYVPVVSFISAYS